MAQGPKQTSQERRRAVSCTSRFGAFSLFGGEWIAHLISFLPAGAADSIIGAGAFGPSSDDLGVLGGSLVFLAWTAAAFFGAILAMRKRDS